MDMDIAVKFANGNWHVYIDDKLQTVRANEAEARRYVEGIINAQHRTGHRGLVVYGSKAVHNYQTQSKASELVHLEKFGQEFIVLDEGHRQRANWRAEKKYWRKFEHQVEMAFVAGRWDCYRKRPKRNPYPPGKRHNEYERGYNTPEQYW